MGNIVTTTTVGGHKYRTTTPGSNDATCTVDGDSVTIDDFVTETVSAGSKITFNLKSIDSERKDRKGASVTVSILSGSTVISTGTASFTG